MNFRYRIIHSSSTEISVDQKGFRSAGPGASDYSADEWRA